MVYSLNYVGQLQAKSHNTKSTKRHTETVRFIGTHGALHNDRSIRESRPELQESYVTSKETYNMVHGSYTPVNESFKMVHGTYVQVNESLRNVYGSHIIVNESLKKIDAFITLKDSLRTTNESAIPTNESFRPVNDDYMKTFKCVCIKGKYGSQKLVVYNSLVSRSSYIGHFPIEYKRSRVPVSLKLKKTIAYFIPTRWPHNFFHNIDDALVPTYLLLRDTNQLGNQSNVLFEKQLSPSQMYRGCAAPKICNVVEAFFRLLPLKWPPIRYGYAKQGVCYRYGVVYTKHILNNTHFVRDRSQRKINFRREMAEYVKKASGIAYTNHSVCPHKRKKSQLLVTIIEREMTRKIINIASLKTRLTKGGVKNIHIAKMAKMTMLAQLQLVHCSDVLIGAQGAGLIWALYMKPHSALIELAWPEVHEKAGFFYNKMFRNDSSITVFPFEIKKNDVHFIATRRHLATWFREVNIKVNETYMLSTLKNIFSIIRSKRSGNIKQSYLRSDQGLSKILHSSE